MGSSETFANHEIVTIAVYLLGGAHTPVDTEDVAVLAHKLVPGRFSWRKYKDQINLDAVRKRLWDSKSPAKGFLQGSEGDGWMVTETGKQFAEQNSSRLEAAPAQAAPRNRAERAWFNRERQRMLATTAFAKHSSGDIQGITTQEAERFFRIDEYVAGEMRVRKVLRILNEFGTDPELGEAVKDLAKRVREEHSDE